MIEGIKQLEAQTSGKKENERRKSELRAESEEAFKEKDELRQ